MEKNIRLIPDDAYIAPWFPEYERRIKNRFRRLRVDEEGKPYITNYKEYGPDGELGSKKYTIEDMMKFVMLEMDDAMRVALNKERKQLAKELKTSFKLAGEKQSKQKQAGVIIAFELENINRIIDKTAINKKHWYDTGFGRAYGKNGKTSIKNLPETNTEEQNQKIKVYYKNLRNQRKPENMAGVIIKTGPNVEGVVGE